MRQHAGPMHATALPQAGPQAAKQTCSWADHSQSRQGSQPRQTRQLLGRTLATCTWPRLAAAMGCGSNSSNSCRQIEGWRAGPGPGGHSTGHGKQHPVRYMQHQQHCTRACVHPNSSSVVLQHCQLQRRCHCPLQCSRGVQEEFSAHLADGRAQAALHNPDGRLRLKGRHVVLRRWSAVAGQAGAGRQQCAGRQAPLDSQLNCLPARPPLCSSTGAASST